MSTKKVSDATAKRRLLALCDLLESLPASQFDYGTFGQVATGTEKGTDPLKEPNVCGTTACALGWAPGLAAAKRAGIRLQVFAEQNWNPNEPDVATVEFVIGHRKASWQKVAKKLFGLPNEHAWFLFQPESDLGPLRSPSYDASARDVADHIRDFVAIRYS